MWKAAASVDPPAEVSTSPNHTTKWTAYKSGTGEVLSAVEAVDRTIYNILLTYEINLGPK